MEKTIRPYRILPLAAACAFGIVLLALWACQVTSDKKPETASFDQMYDKLAPYDSVVIVFNDGNGNFLDTVFAGKVDSHAKLQNLPVKGWDGGKADILISGFNGRILVYQIEKRFDGSNNKVDTNILLIEPASALNGDVRNMAMQEGDSLPLPRIAVTPDNLSDKRIFWRVSDTALLLLGPDYLKAKKQGSATLTAKLRSDSAKTFAIQIAISRNGSGIDSPVVVAKDTTPPNKPVVQGPATSATDQPTWTWSSGGGDGAGAFRFSLDIDSFPKPETTALSYAPASALPDGAHTLYVQERDSAGNWSASGKFSILISIPVPGAPIVKVVPAGTTNNPEPVWSWSGTGSGGFQFRLDSNSFVGMTSAVADTTFTPSAPLSEGPHTLYVRQKNAADAWSPSGNASVTVDLTPPPVPKVFGTSPTNLVPKWTWAGSGGAGVYRYRLNDSGFTGSDKETTDTSYALASAATGTTYILYVQERDLAGNWSGAGSKSIFYDLTQPVISILSPQASGTYYTSSNVTVSGTATGPHPITKVTYRIGTGSPSNATFTAPNWSIPAFALPEGSLTQVTVDVVDNAGNSAEASLNVFLDATAPSAPTLTTGPAAATAALKGSFGWNSGVDGTTGSGLNGRYRYNLNGGPWKDTTAVLLMDLPLQPGNNVFNVQEQDRALLWSASASRSVVVDTTAPLISLTSPANPATSASLNVILVGQVKDSGGTGVASMVVTGQASGTGAVTITGTTWATAALTLASGPNTLRITATDLVGNSRTLAVQITVNVPAPVVKITTPSDSLTLTHLDTLRVYYTIDGVAGNKLFNIPKDSVYRLVVASPPNASGNIGRDSVKITRDATPPQAPTLSRSRTPSNDSAVWTWTSNGDNPGGTGMRSPKWFRYSLNYGATWTESSQTKYKAAAEGSYTLIVQEEDNAGNWSASSQEQTIVVDKTPPSVAITTRDNYVTNRSKVLIYYKVNNAAVATPLVCDLTLPDQGNICTASATDSAGNTGSASITVWYRPNTMFFTTNGSGPGSTWDSASSDLSTIPDGKELWFANGNYAKLPSGVSYTLFGGFNLNQNGYPYSTANRDSTGTAFIGHQSVSAAVVRIDRVIINGSFYSYVNTKLQLDDVRIAPLDTVDFGLSLGGDSNTVNNLIITGKPIRIAAVDLGYTVAIFNGGMITNNSFEDNGWGMLIAVSKVILQGNLRISGNTTPSDHNPAQISMIVTGAGSSELDVGRNVILDCQDRDTFGTGDVSAGGQYGGNFLNCGVAP